MYNRPPTSFIELYEKLDERLVMCYNKNDESSDIVKGSIAVAVQREYSQKDLEMSSSDTPILMVFAKISDNPQIRPLFWSYIPGGPE